MKLQKYLFLLIILYLCFTSKKNIENLFVNNTEIANTSCCGGLSPNEFNESTNRPPSKIRRCMKDYDYYKPCPLKGNRKIWSLKEKRGYTFDTILQRWYKNQNSCCEGRDQCVPTNDGGKCRLRSGSGYYIFDREGEKKILNEDDIELESYEYKGSNIDSIDISIYFNYIMLLLITLFIIYYFHKIFIIESETEQLLKEYGDDYIQY